MNVPAARELVAYVNPLPYGIEVINKHFEQIKRLARLKDIKFAKSFSSDYAARNIIQVMVPNAELWLDVEGVVDLGKERQRLEKEAKAIADELDKIARKLGNLQFLAKAKPEVIAEQRERQAEAEAALRRIEAALAQLGAG